MVCKFVTNQIWMNFRNKCLLLLSKTSRGSIFLSSVAQFAVKTTKAPSFLWLGQHIYEVWYSYVRVKSLQTREYVVLFHRPLNMESSLAYAFQRQCFTSASKMLLRAQLFRNSSSILSNQSNLQCCQFSNTFEKIYIFKFFITVLPYYNFLND